jgi:CMP-N-acetylneuraminic acid synthetase
MACSFGFVVVDRPAELATSDASVQDVMLHAWDVAHEHWREVPFAAAVVLYGNVPVRPHGLTDRAVSQLLDSGCDSVRSFSGVGKWHPRWMAKLTGEASDIVEPLYPGSVHRRQDLEQLYLHDGGVVAVSAGSLLGARANRQDPHAFFGTNRRGFALRSDECVIEIDHPRDLFWAEAALRSQSTTAAQAEFAMRTAV